MTRRNNRSASNALSLPNAAITRHTGQKLKERPNKKTGKGPLTRQREVTSSCVPCVNHFCICTCAWHCRLRRHVSAQRCRTRPAQCRENSRQSHVSGGAYETARTFSLPASPFPRFHRTNHSGSLSYCVGVRTPVRVHNGDIKAK